MSAAQARKINSRVKRPRLIAPPARYTVFEGNTTYEDVAFKKVQSLCPNVTTSTLTRRLAQGERNLVELRRKPQPMSKKRKKK